MDAAPGASCVHLPAPPKDGTGGGLVPGRCARCSWSKRARSGVSRSDTRGLGGWSARRRDVEPTDHSEGPRGQTAEVPATAPASALLWDTPRRQALHPGRPGGAPWRGATRCPPSWSAEVGELGQTFPVALVRPVEGDLQPYLLRCHLGQQVRERWEVGAAGHAGQSAGGGGLTRARAVTPDHIVELCANTNPRLKSPSHGFAGSIGLRGARSLSRGARFPARTDAGPCGGDRRGLRRVRVGAGRPDAPDPRTRRCRAVPPPTAGRGTRGGDAPRKPGTVAASRAVCM